MSVEVIGEIEAETASAILFYVEETEQKHWLPLSQVDEIHRTRPARIMISDWLAWKIGVA